MFSSKISRNDGTFSRPLVVAISVSVTALIAVTLAVLAKDFSTVITTAGQRNLVLTQVLEEHARRAFDLSKVSIDELSHNIVVGGRPVVSPDITERMERWLKADPLIVSYWVFDASGDVVHTTQAVKTDSINFADRPYFISHKAGEDVHVGMMTRGRIDGKWFFSLSKRLVDRSGAFCGVLLASIQTDYFTALYQRLGLGENDNIGIYRLDGRVVARRLSNWTGDTVPSNASSQMFTSLAKSPVGTYRSTSPIDSVDRIIGYRTVEGWPLVVAAGTAMSDILADWRQRAVQTAGFALVLLAVLSVTLICGLRTEARQRERDRAAHREIDAERHAAEQANDAKTRFLASVSHDLRQPLQALRFLLFNVARYADKPDQVNACTQMEKTLEATELMLSRLMDFASLESGNVSVQKERFRLDQLVWDVIRQSDEEAAAKGLAIGARLQPCWTESDPILLGRIVRNLVANALRYTERGGILVGIRRRCGKLRLEIFDTGKGIPPDQQQVIFEEFRQLDNPERNRTKGHGLGLAIVAKTAELLGHQLFLRSVVGRGSVFAIEVPKVNGLDQPTLPVISQPVHVSGAISILVIEDDKMQAEALMSIFTGCGYSVFVAHDADAAMTAQIPSPDIIISDYRLPGNMTGVDTVASIRQLHARPIPAIIATGDTEAKIAIEAARADCDILIKPFTPAALMLAIAKKLGSDNRVVDGSENAPIAPLG